MERQYAQRDPYHDEVDTQNSEEADDEQIYFVSPEDSVSVVDVNPDWDGAEERWVPTFHRKLQQAELPQMEHEVPTNTEKNVTRETENLEGIQPFSSVVDSSVLSTAPTIFIDFGEATTWVPSSAPTDLIHIDDATDSALSSAPTIFIDFANIIVAIPSPAPTILIEIDDTVSSISPEIESSSPIPEASTEVPASGILDGLPAYNESQLSSSPYHRSPSACSVASCISSTMEVTACWENDECERKPVPRSYLQPIERKISR